MFKLLGLVCVLHNLRLLSNATEGIRSLVTVQLKGSNFNNNPELKSTVFPSHYCTYIALLPAAVQPDT